MKLANQKHRHSVIAREGGRSSKLDDCDYWMPAFAGMTPEKNPELPCPKIS
jgi:hypothetical protein